MAERLVTEIQTDFLTCKLCQHPYTEPKVLSCLHTFCRRCLERHSKRHATAAAGDEGPCVFCPLCRQICDLPRKGVRDLPDNHLLRNLLDMINSKSLQSCDLCREEGQNNGATYCCVKCEEFMCDECTMLHKRTILTKEHLVVNVGSMMDICKGLQGKVSPSKVNSRLLTKFGRFGNDLTHPTAICVNKADEIVVSNSNNIISVFTMTGECKKEIDQQSFYGDAKNYLPNRGVAVTTEGYLAVAMRKDVTSDSVHVAVVQSLAAREISTLTVRTKSGVGSQPFGVAVTADNHYVVTDIGKHCFYIFDPDLRHTKSVGRRGSRGMKQFKSPHFVAVTHTDDILISDYDNHCVKVYDAKGKSKFRFGHMGHGDGEFIHPMGVCSDRHGNLFVADRDNHRVQMFDAQGGFVAHVLDNTCKDGDDVRPQDIAITNHGHLAVLLRGIEGVDIAEIHVYQYGSSRLQNMVAQGKQGTAPTSGVSTEGGVNGGGPASQGTEPGLRPPHGRLPPLLADANSNTKGLQGAPHAQPDLVPETARGAAATSGRDTGNNSKICVIQ